MENLTKALFDFQSTGITVTKNARAAINDRAGYQYADLPHVIETIRPTLASFGLMIQQSTYPLDATGTVLKTELIHIPSGERINMELPLYMDEKPQAFGSRLTYLRRYSWLTILGMAPDDDDDGAAYQPNVRNHQRPSYQNQVQGSQNRQTGYQRQQLPAPREPGEDDLCPDCGSEMRPSRNGGTYCHACWQAKRNQQGGR